jgi:hypothetical protein
MADRPQSKALRDEASPQPVLCRRLTTQALTSNQSGQLSIVRKRQQKSVAYTRQIVALRSWIKAIRLLPKLLNFQHLECRGQKISLPEVGSARPHHSSHALRAKQPDRVSDTSASTLGFCPEGSERRGESSRGALSGLRTQSGIVAQKSHSICKTTLRGASR